MGAEWREERGGGVCVGGIGEGKGGRGALRWALRHRVCVCVCGGGGTCLRGRAGVGAGLGQDIACI